MRNVPRPISWVREGDCIRCTSHKLNASGYAYVKRNKRRMLISNEIARMFRGLVNGLCARHTCDNRWCINPAHIISGTLADNNRDRMLRGRSATGVRSGRYKHGRAVAARKAEYKRDWYLANRESVLARTKAWYEARKK